MAGDFFDTRPVVFLRVPERFPFAALGLVVSVPPASQNGREPLVIDLPALHPRPAQVAHHRSFFRNFRPGVRAEPDCRSHLDLDRDYRNHVGREPEIAAVRPQDGRKHDARRQEGEREAGYRRHVAPGVSSPASVYLDIAYLDVQVGDHVFLALDTHGAGILDEAAFVDNAGERFGKRNVFAFDGERQGVLLLGDGYAHHGCRAAGCKQKEQY